MWQQLKLILKDTMVFRFTLGFLGMLVVYAVVGIWKWNKLPPELPLYYSLPRSDEQLGSPLQLLLLPCLSSVFFLSSLLIASRLYPKERLAGVLIVFMGTVSAFLLVVAYINIIFLIT